MDDVVEPFNAGAAAAAYGRVIAQGNGSATEAREECNKSALHEMAFGEPVQ
jgi:hypothetical protein